MIVSELIKLLQNLPNQDQRITVLGYEGGYSDIEKDSIDTKDLKLNVNEQWYYGKHDFVRPPEIPDCTAYVINR